ncbi:ABC transporter ATP-binding protein [Curvibacter sp. CHRR-16]|uniref:ABC transporter ATP-binding protein n=1 Tax=Curvibacter sp. CHRR-16 TaxID=2835872 RepID=UPI001BDACD83|nr:ABC transporter ATP-binding protein [Curvibacter sp. CHRR-16]MBT0569824.1 ABC transporter ATP-binding protein [Curvibacter sp. CHRR-16]
MTLQVHDLCVQYSAQTVLQLEHAHWECGQLGAVIGPNGCGKTTLLKAIAGVLPSTGQVQWQGRELSPALRPQVLAYMPQDNQASQGLTVLEVVLLGRLRQLGVRVSTADRQGVYQVLERLGISHLAGRSLHQLSGGQRQLVWLAQALLAQPQVLLLDEPTSALDMEHQLQVLQLLRDLAHQHGLCVVVVLHDLAAVARFADTVLALQQGCLHSQGAAADMLQPDCLAQLFRVQVDMLQGFDGLLIPVPRCAILV